MWTKSNACPVNPTRGNVHTARQQQQRIEFKDTFNIFHLLLLFLLLLLRRLRWWYHRLLSLPISILELVFDRRHLRHRAVSSSIIFKLYIDHSNTYQSTVDLIVSHFFDSTTNTAQQLITTRHAKEVVVWWFFFFSSSPPFNPAAAASSSAQLWTYQQLDLHNNNNSSISIEHLSWLLLFFWLLLSLHI